MGSRSTARRLAMQAIYQTDISGTDIGSSLNNLFDEEELSQDTMDFAAKLAKGTISSLASIDELIAKNSKNWSTERINPVEKSILRLAIYELTVENKTPKAVIIDEALELVKRYSDAKSSKFINGILGSVVV
jgi:transcription antitermination protein NusB